MTFDEYIQNPMGKKNAVYSFREMYRATYTAKWNAIKLRENGYIRYTIYTSDGNYYVHFKIPSEVVSKFYYDTIIKLSPQNATQAMERTLSNYNVQFWSNDPSFVFTFAHAFATRDLLIRDLDSKMSKLAIKMDAVEKNPSNQVGYVKSIYFAYLEMKSLNLFSKNRWTGVAKSYKKSVWKDTVTHADDKISDRQEKGAAYQKDKKKRETRKAIQRVTNAVTNNRRTGINQSPNKSPNQKDIGKFKKTNFNTINSKFKKK